VRGTGRREDERGGRGDKGEPGDVGRFDLVWGLC
jgi:hypothetical protein